MNREFLKGLGLSDEHVDSIMKEHGKTVNSIKDKADKVDSLESQIEDYEKQIKDRDKQLKDLSKQSEGNEELQKQIKELQANNEKVKDEWQKKFESEKKRNLVLNALKDSKVKKPEVAIKSIDLDNISLKDEKLIGFDEQFEDAKEAFAFEEDNKLGGRQPHNSDPNKQPKGVTKEQFDQMGYADRVQLYTDNPDLYQKLNS